jgi:hypothetical protein
MAQRKTKIQLLYDKLENVAYSIAEAILTGIVIGGIVWGHESQTITIILGVAAMVILFAFSYICSVKNSKD